MSEPGKPEIKIFLSLPNQKICMLGQLNRKLFAATQIKPLLSMTSYWTFSYFTKTAYFLNASKPEHLRFGKRFIHCCSHQGKACLIASIYPLSDRLIQKTGCWLYMRLPFAKTGKPCFRLEGYFLTIRTQSELFGDRKPLFGRELWS